VCIGDGRSLGVGTHKLEEFHHKNQFRGGREELLVELSTELRGIPWRRRYCAPPDIKMPVIDVCTVSGERVRERETEEKREKDRVTRYAGVANGTCVALHPRSGTLLKYGAVITGWYCVFPQGLPCFFVTVGAEYPRFGRLKKKEKENRKVLRGNRCIYIRVNHSAIVPCLLSKEPSPAIFAIFLAAEGDKTNGEGYVNLRILSWVILLYLSNN